MAGPTARPPSSTPSPSPTPPAAAGSGEPDAGDEQPIRVRVRVRVTGSAPPRVSPRVVAAFLALRFVVHNRSDRPARVGVARVGRVLVRPGGRAVLRSQGLEPGGVRITGPGGSGLLRVRPGGG